MKIIKILNNNLILGKDDQENEVIVSGKAIGYNGKVGNIISEDQIEKIYILDNKKSTNEYINLIENMPESYVDITHYIIKQANEVLKVELHTQLFITLIDHISFAIKRYNENIVIQNHLLWEVKKFYPKEFCIGKEAVDYINHMLQIELPEEEAGNIAFHLVNAQSDEQNMNQTIKTVKIVKDILAIVEYQFASTIIDKNSLDYTRFITHLQFFVHRLIENKLMESQEEFLLLQVINKYKKEYECAKKIEAYIKKTMQVDLSDDELVYLTIYIKRIVK